MMCSFGSLQSKVSFLPSDTEQVGKQRPFTTLRGPYMSSSNDLVTCWTRPYPLTVVPFSLHFSTVWRQPQTPTYSIRQNRGRQSAHPSGRPSSSSPSRGLPARPHTLRWAAIEFTVNTALYHFGRADPLLPCSISKNFLGKADPQIFFRPLLFLACPRNVRTAAVCVRIKIANRWMPRTI